jgi:hypothetical protein
LTVAAAVNREKKRVGSWMVDANGKGLFYSTFGNHQVKTAVPC